MSDVSVANWAGKYWGWLLLLAFAVALVWALRSYQVLEQHSKYTIGYITSGHFTAKSGRYFNFRFTVADSVYVGSNSADKGMDETEGARFVVKYDSLDPTTNIGYFILAIPDSIRQAPPSGWLKPPFPVPQWLLDRGKEQRKN